MVHELDSFDRVAVTVLRIQSETDRLSAIGNQLRRSCANLHTTCVVEETFNDERDIRCQVDIEEDFSGTRTITESVESIGKVFG